MEYDGEMTPVVNCNCESGALTMCAHQTHHRSTFGAAPYNVTFITTA